jgi:subtilase family protein
MLRTSRTLARVLAGAGTAALGLLPALPAAAATAAPFDAVRDTQQWVFNMMNVRPAWQVTEGKGVTVAVIDSGVYPQESDLSDGSVIAGPDLTGLHTSPQNANWGQHGTWMASIIAGHGHDGGFDGIMGIAPEAKVLSIRVIPDKGDPGYQTYNNEAEARIQHELADGIMTAVKDHAQVISMSIGYSAPSGVVRNAITYAYEHGTVLVASSGNSGGNDTQHGKANGLSPVSFPAEYPGVLGVGAVTIDGTQASFSSGNLSVQVAAPGKGVPAQGRNGLYYTVDGTSPACALVAGVAALLKSRYPTISPALVTEALTTSAQQTPAGSYDVNTGFGIVDADAALVKAGKLMKDRPQGSQVPLDAHFGGGPAAGPAAPVAPRGDGERTVFIALALVSVAVALAGLAGLVKTRESRGGRLRDHDRRVLLARPRRGGRDSRGPGDVLRRHRRVPGGRRPPPGRPGAVPLRRRGPLVAGDPRGRHPGRGARDRGARALPGRRDAAAFGQRARAGGHAPGALAGDRRALGGRCAGGLRRAGRGQVEIPVGTATTAPCAACPSGARLSVARGEIES